MPGHLVTESQQSAARSIDQLLLVVAHRLNVHVDSRPLGLAVEQLGLGKYLRHLIERRNTVIKAAAENAAG